MKEKDKKNSTEVELLFTEIRESKFYKYFERKLSEKTGYIFLGLFALADTFLLFIPMEPLVALYAIKRNDISIGLITLYVSIINTIGYVAIFLIGMWGSNYILGFLEKIFGPMPTQEVASFLSQGIIPLSAISSFFSFPFPLTIFSISAGMLSAPVFLFAVGAFIGKATRYWLSAFIGRKYGVAFLEKMMQHTTLFYLILLVMSVLILWKMFI